MLGYCDAMEQEIHAIHKNQTWQLVDLPLGRKPITIKWVYKVKTHVKGIIAKLKANLMAKSFQ
jgi:hypothetical protein